MFCGLRIELLQDLVDHRKWPVSFGAAIDAKISKCHFYETVIQAKVGQTDPEDIEN